MFNPTREQARQFFCSAWAKYRAQAILAGLEVTAVNLILAHPEYQDFLSDAEKAIDKEFTPEEGKTNPFLHLSLHLAIEEQLSINQPQGIKAIFEQLLTRYDAHTAKHIMLDCLGETIWHAQRKQTEPDGNAYLDCILRKKDLRR